MRTLLLIAMTVSLSIPVFLQAAKRDSPFACDRAALNPEQRKRHFDELGPALRSLRKSTHELADGFEFEFPADAASYKLLAEWVGGNAFAARSSISTCALSGKADHCGCA